PALLAAALTLAALALAQDAGTQGIAMATVVDTVEAQGFAADDVEQQTWQLMSARRPTPAGFICRTMQRRQGGKTKRQRMYAFTLVPWSPHLDQQLELELEPDAR